MISVLKEIMEPEIQESKKVGRIEGAVVALRSAGHDDSEIETIIIESFGLTVEEAAKYLQY